MSEHAADITEAAVRPRPRSRFKWGPAGIGGWLILAAIGVVLAPIQSGVALARSHYDWSTSTGAWAELGFLPFLVGFVVLAGLFVFQVCIASLFFRRKRSAPRAVIAYHTLKLAILALATIASLAGWGVGSVAPVELIFGVVISAAWIGYFLTSKRVKNTFTR